MSGDRLGVIPSETVRSHGWRSSSATWVWPSAYEAKLHATAERPQSMIVGRTPQGGTQGACFRKGYPHPGLAPELKPVIQHNADTKPLNPLIVVNQTLPIPVVILEKPLQRIPNRKTVPKLHRRPVIRPQIIQQLQRKRPILRQLVHRVITRVPKIPLDIRIIILAGTLRQPVPRLHLEQPSVIAIRGGRLDPVPAPGPGGRLAVGLVVEADGDPVQGARPDIPVQLVPEKQLGLVVGLPERR